MNETVNPKELADQLEIRWDINESENNPLHNGKVLRIGYHELDTITRSLRGNPEHEVEGLYKKFHKGDAVTDEELTELYKFFQRCGDLARQCSTFFGRAVISELSLEVISLNSIIQARKKAP